MPGMVLSVGVRNMWNPNKLGFTPAPSKFIPVRVEKAVGLAGGLPTEDAYEVVAVDRNGNQLTFYKHNSTPYLIK
jgi:hypothetical protein